MNNFSFTENELTGSRLVIPFTPLGHFGPKHHAIVLGINDADGEVWIAELSRKHGYRLVALEQWIEDNDDFVDKVEIAPNEGDRSNYEVARSAIDEILAREDAGKDSNYDVVLNNCENFVDRHTHGTWKLSPQVKKTMKLMGFAIAGGAMIWKKHLESREDKDIEQS